jgi:hypothetical protein
MKEQLITFETAKLAKQKQFGYDFNKSLPEYVPIFYCESDLDDVLDMGTLEETECQGEDIIRGDFYFRPTQSLLQKWLREVHKIHVDIKEWELTDWYFYIKDGRTSPVKNIRIKIDVDTKWEFDLYEEALEVGLLEGLKLVKDELV